MDEKQQHIVSAQSQMTNTVNTNTENNHQNNQNNIQHNSQHNVQHNITYNINPYSIFPPYRVFQPYASVPIIVSTNNANTTNASRMSYIKSVRHKFWSLDENLRSNLVKAYKMNDLKYFKESFLWFADNFTKEEFYGLMELIEAVYMNENNSNNKSDDHFKNNNNN